MVVGVCIPRPVDLERAGGLAVIGIAQVRRDAAVLSLELLDRVKGAACQGGNRRVQSPTGNEQQREAGTGLLKVDANGAFFVEACGSSLRSLLSKHARRCGHRRRRGAGCQYITSDRIHNRRPPLIIVTISIAPWGDAIAEWIEAAARFQL